MLFLYEVDVSGPCMNSERGCALLCAAWSIVVAAYKNGFDVLLMQTLELFCNERSCRIAGENAIVEISTDKKNIGLILQGEVDQNFEATLEVALAFEPLGSVLDRGWV